MRPAVHTLADAESNASQMVGNVAELRGSRIEAEVGWSHSGALQIVDGSRERFIPSREPDEQITAEVIETELESEHSTDALETRGGFVSSERDARGCQHLPRSGERCEEAGAGEEICALAKKKLATPTRTRRAR